MEPDDVVDVAETAEMLGIALGSVSGAVKRGSLRPWRVMGRQRKRYLFLRSEVERYAAARREAKPSRVVELEEIVRALYACMVDPEPIEAYVPAELEALAREVIDGAEPTIAPDPEDDEDDESTVCPVLHCLWEGSTAELDEHVRTVHPLRPVAPG